MRKEDLKQENSELQRLNKVLEELLKECQKYDKYYDDGDDYGYGGHGGDDYGYDNEGGYGGNEGGYGGNEGGYGGNEGGYGGNEGGYEAGY